MNASLICWWQNCGSSSPLCNARGLDTGILRVHRLSSFVIAQHCTFGTFFPEDEVTEIGDGGLDCARARRGGVCIGGAEGREGPDDTGFAGAELGAGLRCGLCGVVGGTWRWVREGSTLESECGRATCAGAEGRRCCLGGGGGGSAGRLSPASACAIVKDIPCGMGMAILGGLGSGPGCELGYVWGIGKPMAGALCRASGGGGLEGVLCGIGSQSIASGPLCGWGAKPPTKPGFAFGRPPSCRRLASDPIESRPKPSARAAGSDEVDARPFAPLPLEYFMAVESVVVAVSACGDLSFFIKLKMDLRGIVGRESARAAAQKPLYLWAAQRGLVSEKRRGWHPVPSSMAGRARNLRALRRVDLDCLGAWAPMPFVAAAGVLLSFPESTAPNPLVLLSFSPTNA